MGGISNENTKEEYLPGQLDFWSKLFRGCPDEKKDPPEPATVLDDSAVLFGPSWKDRDEPEDDDAWPYGED